eukprot:TRINITY_DN6174_c0_g1_i1.p1 TRINITY_DN6174_c0_g1~~TRINITY_DN6174_c0_g1_i1.p1  ORF type:complete len:128 (-),score=8.89 TRINITY_DN6174_c0_g1_i1:122-505(-)
MPDRELVCPAEGSKCKCGTRRRLTDGAVICKICSSGETPVTYTTVPATGFSCTASPARAALGASTKFNCEQTFVGVRELQTSWQTTALPSTLTYTLNLENTRFNQSGQLAPGGQFIEHRQTATLQVS